jgi:hypothetical protein
MKQFSLPVLLFDIELLTHSNLFNELKHSSLMNGSAKAVQNDGENGAPDEVFSFNFECYFLNVHTR